MRQKGGNQRQETYSPNSTPIDMAFLSFRFENKLGSNMCTVNGDQQTRGRVGLGNVGSQTFSTWKSPPSEEKGSSQHLQDPPHGGVIPAYLAIRCEHSVNYRYTGRRDAAQPREGNNKSSPSRLYFTPGESLEMKFASIFHYFHVFSTP